MLCIETSALPFSVALTKGDQLILEIISSTEHRLARDITIFIKDLMQKTGYFLGDLEAIAVSSGPGSYTGLRIGMSVAKGLCFGLDIPLITIATTKSIASKLIELGKGEYAQKVYLSMIDARRMEVYAEGFDPMLNPIFPLQPLIFPEQITLLDSFIDYSIIIGGDGSDKRMSYLSAFNMINTSHVQTASDLITLAQQAFEKKDFDNQDTAVPIYCKAPNITTSKK